jgi:conjugative transfer region protein TrbK
MNPKIVVRVAAVCLLASAMIACAIDVARLHRDRDASASPTGESGDPLTAELARCKALGAEAANDAACKAAWAKSRERFFTPGAPYQGRSIDPFPTTPDVPAKAPTQTKINRAPLAPPASGHGPGPSSDGR